MISSTIELGSKFEGKRNLSKITTQSFSQFEKFIFFAGINWDWFSQAKITICFVSLDCLTTFLICDNSVFYGLFIRFTLETLKAFEMKIRNK